MKLRTRLFALMIALVPLSACASGPGGESADEARFSEIRQSALTASSIAFTAQIRADYGDTVLDYTLDCAVGDGETLITVSSPKLIAGVTATVKDGSAALRFDGLILDPAEVGNGGLTPLTAPALIVGALREGHVSNARRETLGDVSALAVELLDGQNNTQTLWLDPESGALLQAEIQSGGRAVLTCTCENWTVQAGAPG